MQIFSVGNNTIVVSCDKDEGYTNKPCEFGRGERLTVVPVIQASRAVRVTAADAAALPRSPSPSMLSALHMTVFVATGGS